MLLACHGYNPAARGTFIPQAAVQIVQQQLR